MFRSEQVLTSSIVEITRIFPLRVLVSFEIGKVCSMCSSFSFIPIFILTFRLTVMLDPIVSYIPLWSQSLLLIDRSPNFFLVQLAKTRSFPSQYQTLNKCSWPLQIRQLALTFQQPNHARFLN